MPQEVKYQRGMERHAYLNTLRGLAIIGVVLTHVSQTYVDFPDPWRTWLDYSARGVQLFFVASALTLMMSWRERNDGVVNFYIRRLFRIAPLFWTAILAYILWHGFGPRYWAPSGIGVADIVLTATFLNGFTPNTLSSVVPGGWSIANEMLFYLVFPVVAILARNAASAAFLYVATVWVATKLHWVALAFWLPRMQPGHEYLGTNFASYWAVQQAPVFAAGVLAYYLIKEFPLSSRFRSAADVALALLVVIAMAYAFALTPRWFSMEAGYGLIFCGMAYCLANGAWSWLHSWPMQRLGILSFGIYLSHFIVIDLVRRFVPQDNFLFLPVSFALSLAGATILAAVAHKLIERPGINLGRSLIATINQRPSLQADS